ncbi:hypothetical protein PSTG_13923 [Puccinia striiformis f. sp. tritici PST-78]|uniref:No apical meristem-associated C-terminal domain-containing protein n=1 Tax=Puccinia striiformis f. sp. tritici PST-78 TaxID=1165861 RepID=A0A0L0V0A8_9BASI|nr:hypothetical protein PSTG_13923 [Puccinia striiformis f. sp. tritici PST-78]
MQFWLCADMDMAINSAEKNDKPLEVEPEANKQPLKKKKGLTPRKIAEEKTTPLKKSTTSTAPPSKKKSLTNVALTPRNEATDLVPPSQKSSPSNEAPPADLTDQKGSRSKNYDDEEDIKICHSWLEVSQDPLNSTNHAGDTCWKRVGEHYESTRDDDALYRTWSSVKSHLVAKAQEDKQFKDDIISVHRDLAQQTKTQNDILAVQREALTTLADHAVMSTDLVTVSEASRPFFVSKESAR